MEHVTRDTLREFADQIVARIREKAPQTTGRAFVLALEGELGAGKTTFMQELGRALGIPNLLQSPTYVLMKSYPLEFERFTTLVHIDAYRLNAPAEFQTLKPETFLNDPCNLVCVEWPERVAGQLPAVDLALRFLPDAQREDGRYVEVV